MERKETIPFTYYEDYYLTVSEHINYADWYFNEKVLKAMESLTLKEREDAIVGYLAKLTGVLPVPKNKENKAVNHPKHYNSHPSGIECIEIARHYCFSIGNVFKYIWRAGLKTDADKTPVQNEIQDLEKAKWYIEDRINELKRQLKQN